MSRRHRFNLRAWTGVENLARALGWRRLQAVAVEQRTAIYWGTE